MKNLNGRMLQLVAAVLLVAASANGKTKGNQGNPSPSPSPSNSKKHEQSTPMKNKAVDLRTTIDRMKLKDGVNVVHSENGANVIAEAKGGQVTGWKVTDAKGKPLPSHISHAIEEGECEVCYTSKTNPNVEYCYKVKCPVIVKTPPSKISAH